MSSNNELFKINETGNIHNFITHKIVNNWSIERDPARIKVKLYTSEPDTLHDQTAAYQ